MDPIQTWGIFYKITLVPFFNIMASVLVGRSSIICIFKPDFLGGSLLILHSEISNTIRGLLISLQPALGMLTLAILSVHLATGLALEISLGVDTLFLPLEKIVGA